MPPLPSVPNVVRVEHHFAVGSDAGAIVRTFSAYSGPTPDAATLDNLATTLGNTFETLFLSFMHPDVMFEQLLIFDLTSPTSASGIKTYGDPGSRAGSPLPAGAAVLSNMQIGRRYRGGKPRSYWPFFTAADLATSLAWLPASVSAMTTALDDYRITLSTAGASGTNLTSNVNVSYYQGFTPVTNPITGRTKDVSKIRTPPLVDDVIHWVCAPKVASQRRRNRDV